MSRTKTILTVNFTIILKLPSGNPQLHSIEKVFNGKISFGEVDKVIRNSKGRKTGNSDTDPHSMEMFKKTISTALFYSLFDKYFELGISSPAKETVSPKA